MQHQEGWCNKFVFLFGVFYSANNISVFPKYLMHSQLPWTTKFCPLFGKLFLFSRAGLNEREAPGKIVTAKPPKRLAQLRSVSHALVSTLQKHRSKTSKLIRFGSLHFRDNCGSPCTVVRMWLIYWNRKLYPKKRKNESSNVNFKLR